MSLTAKETCGESPGPSDTLVRLVPGSLLERHSVNGPADLLVVPEPSVSSQATRVPGYRPSRRRTTPVRCNRNCIGHLSERIPSTGCLSRSNTAERGRGQASRAVDLSSTRGTLCELNIRRVPPPPQRTLLPSLAETSSTQRRGASLRHLPCLFWLQTRTNEISSGSASPLLSQPRPRCDDVPFDLRSSASHVRGRESEGKANEVCAID